MIKFIMSKWLCYLFLGCILCSCKKEEPAKLPILSTAPVTNLTTTTAVSGGNIISNGGVPIHIYGVCWSTMLHPTTNDSKTSESGNIISFSSDITGLTPDSTYFLRAFATNSVGTTYGNEYRFRAYAVMDIEGNGYHTVTIGNQIWMLENLKTTKCNDGTPISLVTGSTQWHNLMVPAYCWYNNDEERHKDTYGALYFLGLITYPYTNPYPNISNKICPTGWKLPDLENDLNYLLIINGDRYEAGGKLKDTGTQYWSHPNTGATNESGFTALPGGYRNIDGTFSQIGDEGSWWTSDSTSGQFRVFELYSYGINVAITGSSYMTGVSVRCLKDN